jgi:hypothetical protein
MLSGLLWFVLSLLVTNILGGYARRLVRREAPFYARSNIFIVGTGFGLIVAVLVHFLARTITDLSLAVIFLKFWGLLTTLYLGYAPDPIDWAKKSQQTAGFAAITYVLVTACFFIIG